jgi:hypothetical protein
MRRSLGGIGAPKGCGRVVEIILCVRAFTPLPALATPSRPPTPPIYCHTAPRQAHQQAPCPPTSSPRRPARRGSPGCQRPQRRISWESSPVTWATASISSSSDIQTISMEKGKRDREHGQTGRQRDEPEEGKHARQPEGRTGR